jgi:hypothetical protein
LIHPDARDLGGVRQRNRNEKKLTRESAIHL